MNRRIKMKKLKLENAYLKESLKYARVPQWTPQWTPSLPSVATLVVAYNHDGFMPESMIPEVLAQDLAKEVRKYMVIEGPDIRRDIFGRETEIYRGVVKVVIPETEENHRRRD